MTRIQEKHILCRYPFKHDYIWLAEKTEPSDEILNDPETLIVCAGLELYQTYSKKICHPLLLERSRMKNLIPEGTLCHLSSLSGIRTEIARTAAHQVADWLLEDKLPESKQICIKNITENSK